MTKYIRAIYCVARLIDADVKDFYHRLPTPQLAMLMSNRHAAVR